MLKKVKRSPAFIYSVKRQNQFSYNIVFVLFFNSPPKAVTTDKNNLSYFFILLWQQWEEEEKRAESRQGCCYQQGKSATDVHAFICSLQDHRCAALTAGEPLAGGLLWAVRRSRPAQGECWVKWWEMMGRSGSDGFLKPGEMGGWRRWAAFPDLSDCRCRYDEWAGRIAEHVVHVSADKRTR